jgi:hypothetical protein
LAARYWVRYCRIAKCCRSSAGPSMLAYAIQRITPCAPGASGGASEALREPAARAFCLTDDGDLTCSDLTGVYVCWFDDMTRTQCCPVGRPLIDLACSGGQQKAGVIAESGKACNIYTRSQNVIEDCEESQSGRRLLSVVDMWDRDYSLTIIVVYAGSLRTNGARRWVRRSHTACLICQAVLLLQGCIRQSKPASHQPGSARLGAWSEALGMISSLRLSFNKGRRRGRSN